MYTGKKSFHWGLRVALSLALVFSLAPFAPSSELAYAGVGESADAPVALSPQEEGRAAAAERAANPVELGYIPGEMVVVYEPGATDAAKEEALEAVEGAVPDKEAEFDMGTFATVDIPDDMTVATATERIEEDPAVKYAVPNYLATTYGSLDVKTLAANATLAEDISQQWHLNYVKAPQAWKLLASQAATAQPVKVAVLDTGASLTHNDLRNIVNRKTSIEVVHDENPSDTSSWHGEPLRGDGYTNGGSVINEQSSHGTHVSGIIAAEAGNGGVLGVASAGGTALANRLVDLTVIDAFSRYTQDPDTKKWAAGATLQDLVFALEYARDSGCAIVNMSLGFAATNEKTNALFESLTRELTEKNNMLIVSAAGNSGADIRSMPAACSSVMGVISISERSGVPVDSATFANPTWLTGSTTRSEFSNYGSWCDIAAPGENILSTYLEKGTTNKYAYMGGTSMASPVVAAIAAMVRAANPRLKATEVRSILCSTATDLHTPGKDDQSGYGAVNAEAAVAKALERAAAEPPAPAASVAYATHVQNVGWQPEVRDGARGGTAGRSLRVEAFKVRLVNQPYSGSIQVSAHVQNIGWQNWVNGPAVSGTSGRALRVEALKIRLTGEMANRYDVYYRTHVQNVGDTGWAKNGEPCGSAGYSYRMEAVFIKLVPKGQRAPGSTANHFVHPLVAYQTHVQNIGWQKQVTDGATGGTSGRSLRVEAFRVSLSNPEFSGGIQVSSHVQNIGWQGWVSNGATSGTSGRALRVEALKIRLTGEMANRYDVYYRTHCQNVGWTGWAKNGAPSGTAGYAYRMEAVQIKLVPKGGKAPGTTRWSFYQK